MPNSRQGRDSEGRFIEVAPTIPNTAGFTDAEHEQAKAFVMAYGMKGALAILGELWDRAPAENTLRKWVNDPRIVPDAKFVQHLETSLRMSIVAKGEGIAKALADRLERDIPIAPAADVERLTRSYISFAQLFVGQARERESATITPMMPAGGGFMVMPFAPRELPEVRTIEAEVSA